MVYDRKITLSIGNSCKSVNWMASEQALSAWVLSA